MAAGAPARPRLGDVKLKDTWSYYETWVRGPSNRKETLRRTMAFVTQDGVKRALGMTFLFGVIIRGWYNHLGHGHPEYDWQLGLLRKFRDEEAYAPPKGTPEPPTRSELTVKS